MKNISRIFWRLTSELARRIAVAQPIARAVRALMIVVLMARIIFKLNFTAISGLLAGSMTDPPALPSRTPSARPMRRS